MVDKLLEGHGYFRFCYYPHGCQRMFPLSPQPARQPCKASPLISQTSNASRGGRIARSGRRGRDGDSQVSAGIGRDRLTPWQRLVPGKCSVMAGLFVSSILRSLSLANMSMTILDKYECKELIYLFFEFMPLTRCWVAQMLPELEPESFWPCSFYCYSAHHTGGVSCPGDSSMTCHQWVLKDTG